MKLQAQTVPLNFSRHVTSQFVCPENFNKNFSAQLKSYTYTFFQESKSLDFSVLEKSVEVGGTYEILYSTSISEYLLPTLPLLINQFLQDSFGAVQRKKGPHTFIPHNFHRISPAMHAKYNKNHTSIDQCMLFWRKKYCRYIFYDSDYSYRTKPDKKNFILSYCLSHQRSSVERQTA